MNTLQVMSIRKYLTASTGTVFSGPMSGIFRRSEGTSMGLTTR
jgi:hypothetical protein